MSWKRAMTAGAKPVKHVSRESARVSGKRNKCAAPGCNGTARHEIGGRWVCNRADCQTWAATE